MSQPHRPNLLDLRANSNASTVSVASSSKPLRSPRLHVAGEAPPELSPLDAFAMQSRMLAKQLQASEKDGHRMSRLPPLTMESPLIQQGRSDFFRSLNNESGSESGASPNEIMSSGLGLRTEYEDPDPEERPKSMHPRMSRIPPTPDEVPAVPPIDSFRGRQFSQNEKSSFGARQERSPSPLHREVQAQADDRSESQSTRQDYPLASASHMRNPFRPDSPGYQITKQSSLDDVGLAPPRSLFPQRSSSIMSSPLFTQDEDNTSMASSFHSLPPRKLSSGSAAFSNPMTNASLNQYKRSPSVGSDSSALPRPSFNFSRPKSTSRAGTPGFDSPSRQASSDSQPSFVLADETAHTPVSIHSDAFLEHTPDDKGPGAPSYIYSKFSLPRGKTVQRSEPSEQQAQASYRWDQPVVPPSNVQRYPTGAPPSPPSRPASSSARQPDDSVSLMSSTTRPSMDAGKASMDSSRLPANYPPLPTTRPSQDEHRSSEDAPRGRSRTAPLHEPNRGRTPASQTGTSDSASTIRPPPTARSTAPTASEMSAEEHLAKGIECHENGSLQESTYHLRYAARQNNPTAMLLYALACRHGWGMRANQREGVEWLRKAADYAQIEIADDEDQTKAGKHVDVVDKRTRKAQFALSIYELGVSHMNGWGIEQDKALGLRCFEIAGRTFPSPPSHSRHLLTCLQTGATLMLLLRLGSAMLRASAAKRT